MTSRFAPWSGTIYRSAATQWASGPAMITGAGSFKGGARFNATESFPAVYGSTVPELAMTETLAYLRRANVPAAMAMPLVFKALSVKVERALDLTDPAGVLANLGLSVEQVRQDKWWLSRARREESISQAVGRAAHSAGAQALIALSAHADQSAGVNVIVFPDRLDTSCVFKVLRKSGK